MIIVPLKGDPIKTVDGEEHTVSGFNGMKKDEKSGKLVPAVYIEGVKPEEGGIVLFSDIKEVKRVNVEYNKTTGLLESMGPVKRSYQLPQPNAQIKIQNPFDSKKEMEITVGKIKLSDAGGSYALRIGFSEKDDASSWYDLSTIVDLQNGMAFNRDRFAKLYIEYFPSSYKHKVK